MHAQQNYTDQVTFQNVINELDRLGIYVDTEELDISLPDPKDRVFYEVVMEERKSEDAYLVTGPVSGRFSISSTWPKPPGKASLYPQHPSAR